VCVAVVFVDPTIALSSTHYWHTIAVGGKCLATTESCWLDDQYATTEKDCGLYNGAQVMLWECDDDGYNKWFINLDYADPSPPFEIRAGNMITDGFTQSPNHTSDWCLDGGDIDADSSALSIWECNGLPQQQFNADGLDPKYSFQGSFYFPNGKCLDGTQSMEQGTTPLTGECNGEDQQTWSTCSCSMTCGPHPEFRCDTGCSCDDSRSKMV